jgi:hypothetical protein
MLFNATNEMMCFFKHCKSDTIELCTKVPIAMRFFTCWHFVKICNYSKFSCNYSKLPCCKNVKCELLLHHFLKEVLNLLEKLVAHISSFLFIHLVFGPRFFGQKTPLPISSLCEVLHQQGARLDSQSSHLDFDLV